jgi:hypothetical protein
MKALKKQEKDAKKTAITMMKCEEDESSSESSESDCEDEATMNVEQGMMISTAVPEGVASSISAVSTMECDKAAMKAMKKMEKEQMKAMKKMEKEQKKAMKMEKEAKKMAMAALNGCRDEDDSSCSSESSESECEGQLVRMSRCATITAPEMPSPNTGLPIIVPQVPAPLAPEPSQPSELATAVQATRVSSVAVVETSTTSRIEVCMGGKCKKAGSLALLQEFEKTVGTEGAVVGCKCLGKCGLGPNVRLRSGISAEGCAKGSPLCIGVGFEDVGTIVAGLFGEADLGMTPT